METVIKKFTNNVENKQKKQWDLLDVVSDIETGDLNVRAANEHQAENGAETRNRAKDEKPKLAAERQPEPANENAAEDHPDYGRRNHHHTWK